MLRIHCLMAMFAIKNGRIPQVKEQAKEQVKKQVKKQLKKQVKEQVLKRFHVLVVATVAQRVEV